MKCCLRQHPIFALAALLGLAAPAQAQWTNDPYRGMVSVCSDTSYQDYAQSCELGDGNTLIAWYDLRTGTGQTFYQVLDGAGLPLQQTNGLPVFDGNWANNWGLSGENLDKNLFPDGAGGATIVLWDWREGFEHSDIYGQRVDAQGNRLWGPTGMPLVLWPGSEAVILGNKDFEADSLGNVFIAWAPNVVGDTTQLYIQKLEPSGQLPWGPYGVPVCQIVPSQSGPGIVTQLVPDEAGVQCNMAFSAGVSDGQGGGIWLYVAGASGSLLRLIRINGAGHTLWDVWSPYFCWHIFGDFLRHPICGTVWITSWENRGGGQDYRSYLYSVDVNGQFLFGVRGIPNVGAT
jgi:hypothetical protein